MLDSFMEWADEIPPIEQPMRFGNKAFRTWYTKLVDNAASSIQAALGGGGEDLDETLASEAAGYLCDSFGNATRIDYGTGHETNFILFLMVCTRMPRPCEEAAVATDAEAPEASTEMCLEKEDYSALAVRVFPQYLRVCRKLQQLYMLEPAGSHGVWSLDDYQMLPFLFGSAQLSGHSSIRPGDVLADSVRTAHGSDFMYLEAIQFVTEVKHGAAFAEHSPLLHDLTLLPTWDKVNSNMRKAYLREVLGKRVVMTHTQFGTALPCSWTPSVPQSAARSAPTNPAGHAGVMGVAPWAASVQAQLSSTAGVAPWASAAGTRKPPE